jgi:flagellar hook-associated protein 3 FlgL
VSTRITQSMVSRSVLADLNDAANRISATQRKMASGKQITRPSDDPFGTSRALSLRSELEANRQHQRNVSDASAWNAATDTALSNITDIVQRARELLVQGANDSSSQTARAAIATEIDQLTEALKQETNTSYSGRFIFGGTATTTPPYSVAGVDTYAGNAGTVARGIGPGVAVQVNVVGSSFLGSGQGAADNKLLNVLRDIADDLRGGTPANANDLRGTDLQRLDQNLDALSAIRATVGATGNRLDAAASRLAETEEATSGLLSETEDADMAKTLVDFSMQQSVYQSALHAGANIVQASLLDFLR